VPVAEVPVAEVPEAEVPLAEVPEAEVPEAEAPEEEAPDDGPAPGPAPPKRVVRTALAGSARPKDGDSCNHAVCMAADGLRTGC